MIAARGAYGANERPQPAQKDCPTRAKPKDVVLTTSIQPAEALPGDTVTLKVTAKLSPGSAHLHPGEESEG